MLHKLSIFSVHHTQLRITCNSQTDPEFLCYYSSINKNNINPFHVHIPFLYPLKTSENLKFSDVFRGYRNGTLAWIGLIHFVSLISFYNTWKHQKARGFHLHLTDGALQPFKTWCPSNGQTHNKKKKKKKCYKIFNVFLTRVFDLLMDNGRYRVKRIFVLSGFSFTDTDDLQDSRGPYLFLSTTFARSRKFRYLFATLHVRWLPHIFNCIARNYWAVSQWDLPP